MYQKYLHLSNNGEISSELLMYHKSKNSHHGRTSLVELYSTLYKLGLFIEGIPLKVESSITEITGKLRLASYNLHYENLKASNEGNNLQKSSLGDSVDGGPSNRDGVEGQLRHR